MRRGFIDAVGVFRSSVNGGCGNAGARGSVVAAANKSPAAIAKIILSAQTPVIRTAWFI